MRDYKAAKLDKITINENLGTEASDDYIALYAYEFGNGAFRVMDSQGE